MITLGVIGLSPGNGHPFSWSAIVNGTFDADEITRAGYPGIVAYLSANQDTLGIPGARVTHAWAPHRADAEAIARAAAVPHVAARPEDLVGAVDAVLLLQDDPARQVALARPFLDAGVPLFIDKPLTTTPEDLRFFAEQAASGKFLMSCSSMRYAGECRAVKNEAAALGPLQLITAVGKKDWFKYGIHLLEAVFTLLDDPIPASVRHVGRDGQDVVYLEFADGFPVTLHLFNGISLTFQLSVFGKDGWRLVEVKNWYGMFRDTLVEFIRSVEEGRPRLDFAKTNRLLQTLLAAEESRERGGEVVYLNA